MEKAYSSAWKSSKLPRKQRKYRYNAPEHVQSRFLRVNLSKELKKKFSKRSIRVRAGDKVKLMRGQFKGKEGKVDKIDSARMKIFIEGIEVFKKDGSKAPFPVDPTNLMITELDIEDKKRIGGSK